MSDIQSSKITGPSVWKGADFAHDNNWVHELTADEIGGLEAALAALEDGGFDFPGFSREDFSIGPLGAVLDDVAEELENGRGFKLLRGLPVDRFSDDQIKMIYFAIGLHMGKPVRQNPRGDLLGLVMNIGDITKKETRVYETNLYLPYHTDPSDVVGLLCVRRAMTGGMSSLVSAAAIYNEIIDRCPDLLEVFYQPFCYAHLGDDKTSPVFSFHDGKLSCRYLRQYIELGSEEMAQPLSAAQIAALDLFDEIMMAPEMRIDMMMEPGDIQLANNYTVLHSRTAFEDHIDENRRRKKLRLWLKMPNARQLAADFPGRNGFGPI